MAKRCNRYKRKKNRKKDIRGGRVAGRDISAREREITELLQYGDVKTKRRQDGTVVLKEVINDVSQGKGPSALIPCFFASSIAGIISCSSSVPNSACGFNA